MPPPQSPVLREHPAMTDRILTLFLHVSEEPASRPGDIPMWGECIWPLALGSPPGRAVWPSPLIPWAVYVTPLGSAILRPHQQKQQASPWHDGTCVADHWPARVPGLPRFQACGTDSASGKRSCKVTLQRGMGQRGTRVAVFASNLLHRDHCT